MMDSGDTEINPNSADAPSSGESTRPADEPLTDLLAKCDERLASGDSVAEIDEELPPESNPKLQRGLAFLRRLDRLRPGRGDAEGDPGIDPRFASAESSWRHGDPTRIGRFQIRRKIGHGGFGAVYLAFDPVLRRSVALKIPHPRAILTAELRERFQLEATAAAGLDHRNIVQVYESGTAGPIHYIAAAYCPGISLAAWLREQSEPVPVRSAALLVAQVADGVQHAHERGILHRDLKPGNILLTPIRGGRPIEESATVELGSTMPLDALDFLPRITDFGMAKRVGEWESDGGINEDPAAPLTKTGAVMGTPSHMAPEQAAGRTKDIGPHTDVHGLGVILYELLTGQTPFLAESTFDTLRRVQYDEPLSPRRLRPKLPRDLETICLKCLQKEPKRRYQTARELAEDLRAFVDGKTIKARSVGPIEKAWRWSVREPVVAGLLVLLAVVVTSAIGGLYRLWTDARAQAALAINERNAAVNARERAEEFERQARTLVGELTQTAGRIANLPALARTRRELSEKLLAFHENFLRADPDDPRDLFATANAYLTAGRIRADLGNAKEALAAYRRSTELIEKLLSKEPDSPRYREQYAWACFWTAKQLETDGAPNDRIAPLYARSVSTFQELLARYPDTIVYQSSLGVHLANRSLLLRRTGRAAEAEADVAEAIRLGRIVFAKQPKDDWTRLNLAMYLDEQSLIDRDRRRLDKAVAASEEAVAIMRPVIADPASNVDFRWYFSRFLNSLAGHLAALGRNDERDACRSEAKTVLAEIVNLQPDFVSYRESLAAIEIQMAAAALIARPEEAAGLCRDAASHYRRLMSAFPEATKYAAGFANAQEFLGRLLAESDPAAAIDAYKAALKVVPNHNAALNNCAWLLLNPPDATLRNYTLGLEMASKAAAAAPKAAWILNTEGVARYRNGDHAGALEILERVTALRKTPSLVDEVFLAMIHRKLGNNDKAEAYLDRFLEHLSKVEKPGRELLRFKKEAEDLIRDGKPNAGAPRD